MKEDTTKQVKVLAQTANVAVQITFSGYATFLSSYLPALKAVLVCNQPAASVKEQRAQSLNRYVL